ncbi:MAG: DcrB-related protein, partial [Casimicrobium sp.]
LSRRVNKFEEIGRAPAALGSNPATQVTGVQIATRFKQSSQLTHQLQAVFELTNRNHLLIFTCSSLAPHTDADKSVWQQLLASFALRA